MQLLQRTQKKFEGIIKNYNKTYISKHIYYSLTELIYICMYGIIYCTILIHKHTSV